MCKALCFLGIDGQSEYEPKQNTNLKDVCVFSHGVCAHVGTLALTHVKTRGRCQVSCSVTYCLVPLRQGLWFNMELAIFSIVWQPARPSDSLCCPSVPNHWDYRSMCWGI